jgi:hypothetical protein
MSAIAQVEGSGTATRRIGPTDVDGDPDTSSEMSTNTSKKLLIWNSPPSGAMVVMPDELSEVFRPTVRILPSSGLPVSDSGPLSVSPVRSTVKLPVSLFEVRPSTVRGVLCAGQRVRQYCEFPRNARGADEAGVAKDREFAWTPPLAGPSFGTRLRRPSG